MIFFLQQLVLNDKCPIKYVTYKQSSIDDEEQEVGIQDIESSIHTEQTELQIEEYSGDGHQTTHLARYVRKPIGNCSTEHSDSDSGDTEGADDSQYDSSSDSEHQLDHTQRQRNY